MYTLFFDYSFGFITAQNGVGTSRLQTATSQEPENQSQMWMGRWNNGQMSAPNLNIVKSEPAD